MVEGGGDFRVSLIRVGTDYGLINSEVFCAPTEIQSVNIVHRGVNQLIDRQLVNHHVMKITVLYAVCLPVYFQKIKMGKIVHIHHIAVTRT